MSKGETHETLKAARAYVAGGLSVIPTGADKKPLGKWERYQSERADEPALGKFFANGANVAIVAGAVSDGLLVIDFDAWDVWQEFESSYPELVAGLPVVKTGKGAHLYLRCAAPGKNTKLAKRAGRVVIETRGEGGYVLAPPSLHPSGTHYTLLSGDLASVPKVPQARADALLRACTLMSDDAKAPSKPAADGGQSRRRALTRYAESALKGELARVRGAGEGERNDTLNRAAFSLGQLVGAGLLTRSEVESELERSAPAGLSKAEVAKTIKSGLDSGERDPRRVPERELKLSNGAGKHAAAAGAPPALDDDEHKPYTDLGNGLRLAAKHADKLRFVAEWGWLVWDGRRWRRDTTGAAMRHAKETALSIRDEAAPFIAEVQAAYAELAAAQMAGDESAVEDARKRYSKASAQVKAVVQWAKDSQSSHRLDAMLKLGSSELNLAAEATWFDADPHLLNCLNGVLDLRSGELSPHRLDDFITRLVPIEYDAKAKAPMWEAFLARVLADDKALIAYARRAMGYSLSGLTDEQALFFMYGIGANGKSVFGGVLSELLGDYSQKVRAETLLTKAHDGVSNDVATLAGARLVVAAELPQEKRLNEALVKDLTGGDKMTARFLYKEHFEFWPKFKLWMYGNHKPIIRGTDNGIWRRIRLIPFLVTIPPKERDARLPRKLKAELAGILAWAVRGFAEWQKLGLAEPQKVTDATAEYRTEQDTIGQFIATCCEEDARAIVWASALHEAFEKYAGRGALTAQAFGRQLKERGYISGKGTGGVRVWRGLRLADAIEPSGGAK